MYKPEKEDDVKDDLEKAKEKKAKLLWSKLGQIITDKNNEFKEIDKLIDKLSKLKTKKKKKSYHD